ncbi:hypothetical protein [Xanthomonas tesorieronis]|uniref:hypothetical protein n=1 Tax=Xanthomonas tesorieronis TaxID=3160839 RepID=UPI0035151C64
MAVKIKDKFAIWLFPCALLIIFLFSVLTIWLSNFTFPGREAYVAYAGVVASGVLVLICVRPFTKAVARKLRN